MKTPLVVDRYSLIQDGLRRAIGPSFHTVFREATDRAFRELGTQLR